MAYLTTWTYLLLTCHLVLAAILSVYCFWKNSQLIESGGAVLKSITTPKASHENAGFERENGNVVTIENKPESNGHHVLNNLDIREADEITTTSPMSSDIEMTEIDGKIERSFTVKVDKAKWYMKLSWFLFDIVCVASILVTFSYFIALYPAKKAIDKNASISIEDFNVHGINSVIIFLEVLIAAYPVRLLHAIYPMTYGLAYIIFNLSYWSDDPENNILYPGVLDWNRPGWALLVVLLLAFVGIPFLQFVNFGLYHLKLFIYKRIYHEPYLPH